MSRTVLGVLVRTTGEISLGMVNTDLTSLQAIVGGDLECVELGAGGAHLYCNENGVLDGLRINTVATRAMHELRPTLESCLIVGDAVFLGTTPSGAEGRCPAAVCVLLQRLAAQEQRRPSPVFPDGGAR